MLATLKFFAYIRYEVYALRFAIENKSKYLRATYLSMKNRDHVWYCGVAVRIREDALGILLIEFIHIHSSCLKIDLSLRKQKRNVCK